jgi:hypothetical protein
VIKTITKAEFTHVVATITAITLGFGLPKSVLAQEFKVPDAIGCRECKIRLVAMARLGGENDPASPHDWATAVRLRDGSYLVGPTMKPGTLHQYNASGQFIRAIGGLGDGPQEFSAFFSLTEGFGDSIAVLEVFGRVKILSPDLRVARTFRVPGELRRGLLLSDHRLIANNVVRTADAPRAAVHKLSPLGEIKKSISPTAGVYRRDRPWIHWRAIAAAPAQGVWVGHYNQYRLEHWDSTGNMRQVLVRDPSWFKPWALLDSRPGSPPAPAMTSIWHDARGYLWTFTEVPDPGWKPKKLAGEGPTLTPKAIAERYDTVLEVIDPVAKRVLARSRFPTLLSISARGTAVSLVEIESGDVRLDVWKLELAR